MSILHRPENGKRLEEPHEPDANELDDLDSDPTIAEDVLPSVTLTESINRWRARVSRAINDCTSRADCETLLETATRALLEVHRIDKTVHPKMADISWMHIWDALQEMADGMDIPAGRAQMVFARAQELHQSNRKNGHRIEIEIAPPAGPEDYGPDLRADSRELLPEVEIQPLKLIQPRAWIGTPLPEPEWVVRNRIPRGDVSITIGDGGTGKTTLALQLAANKARGESDWIGAVIDGEAGPVIFLSCEEPEPIVRWRLDKIGRKQGFDYLELDNLHMHFAEPAESLLGIPDRKLIIAPTPLFLSLEKSAMEIKPHLIIVDNVTATYGGNQLDRTQARAYVNLFRSLARRTGAAVLLLDHPTQSGMASGTGRGGSNDWHNAVRARFYISEPKSDDDTQPDSGLRIFEVKKINYGARGERVQLRFDEFTYVLDGGASPLSKIAAEAEVDNLFLALLDKYTARKVNVGCKKGTSYAPSVFSKDPDANGTNQAAFKTSMERHFKAGRIRVEPYGPPAREHHRIARTEVS
jgi:RecA-family ATPase